MIDLLMEQELKIKDVLRDLMKTRGETLLSVSQSTGVPKSTIADWMTNRTPNPVQAVKIAKYFGVSLYYLLFGCEDPQGKGNKLYLEEILSGRFEIDIRRIQR
ncbi:MAG: helix-turn-helix transcriptional regulator [Bdellovibrionaceae bacterium]|nr:helix-turn-helix transcriptional regulator [Pseudobdellovibrionaceae bacterium]